MTRHRSAITIAISVAAGATFWLTARGAPDDPKPADPSCFSSTPNPDVPCPGEETDPAAAINSTAEYAWATFARINRPAFPGNKDDTRRVWETWKNADDNRNADEAIYLENGHEPPKWDVKPRERLPQKLLVPLQQLRLLREQQKDAGGLFSAFLLNNPPVGDPPTNEVRVNRPAFNFILANKLYNRQGQYQYASTHPSFDFPKAAKAVKAVWREAGADTKVADYYSGKVGDKTYVLVAMHVTTKYLPFWFWSTFVHKDQNKAPEVSLVRYQNAPSTLKGTPLENYRLVAELVQGGPGLPPAPSGAGAQVDWVTRTGLPTLLANPRIEGAFATNSSCITCHAVASIGLAGDGTIQYNDVPLEVGVVKPREFNKKGVLYYPLDFLWSLRQAKNFKP